MKYSILILGLSLAVALTGQRSANYGQPKFSPEDGKKLLILGQDLGAVGGLQGYTDGYINNVDCHFPAGVTSYTSIPSLAGLKTFANWGSGDVQAQQYVQTSSFDNSVIVIGLYMVNQLGRIINGSNDNSIRNLATWVKNQDRPVFIRIGYEFDGSWNNYNPSQFVNAWRHIVHVFDEEEVRNAAYVWQSAGINSPNIANWYPGDEYVNWLGYSHFDVFNAGRSIRTFAEDHDKPIMIAEAAPKVDLKAINGTTVWNNWFSKLFDSIYNNDNIKALAYINVNWDIQQQWQGQGWGDSRVQVNEIVEENWRRETCGAPWLTATDSLFNLLEYPRWSSSVKEQDPIVSDELELSSNTTQLIISTKTGSTLDQINIYSLQGNLFYNKSIDSNELVFDLSEFPSGLIVIRRQSQNKIQIFKHFILK